MDPVISYGPLDKSLNEPVPKFLHLKRDCLGRKGPAGGGTRRDQWEGNKQEQNKIVCVCEDDTGKPLYSKLGHLFSQVSLQ